MGNDISGISASDLDQMKKYAGFSPGQVDIIREKFDLMADQDLTLGKDAFMKLMKVNETEANKIFEMFDLDKSGRIDSYQFLCGLALLSQASLKTKAELIFNLYDFDKNRTITKNEMVIMIKTTLTSLNAMSGQPQATIQQAEQKATDILQKYDTNKDGTISLKEFQSFISQDSDILKMLMGYGLISKEDLRPDFGKSDGKGQDMPEPDSDLENEMEQAQLESRDEEKQKIKLGIEHVHTQKTQDADELKREQRKVEQNNLQKPQEPQWKSFIKNMIPRDYKPSRVDGTAPNANLEISQVYGYRCFDSRNNIQVLNNDSFVYFTAAIAIISEKNLDKKRGQRFYLEHTDDITCIDVNENNVVSGQIGANPIICIWDAVTCNTKVVFKGVLKNGIGCVSFSTDGKKIVASALDQEHSIAIYDVEKATNMRLNPVKRSDSDGLIATGKGPRNFIFDLKFDPTDKNIIAASHQQIFIISYDAGLIKMQRTIWDKGNQPQTALCVGFAESNIITGMFKGHLLVWKSNRMVKSVQAHTLAVLSITTRKGQGVISGGRDGMIIVWDNNLNVPQLKIDIKEAKPLSNRVIAISEMVNMSSSQVNLIVGTRGGQIYQFVNQKWDKLYQGHWQGKLSGLAMHPKQQQAFTIGEDCYLACWDLKMKRLLSGVKLDYPGNAINISSNGKYMAVGCTNGNVLIVDPKTLVVTFTFQDRDKPISLVQFSPSVQGETLAVAYSVPSCEVLIYDVQNHFQLQHQLRASSSTVTHMDYGKEGKYLICNNKAQEILLFDLDSGKQYDQSQLDIIQDEKWETWSCIYGWQSQGVWPPCSNGGDINAVDRSNKGDILISGDDFSQVKIFQYPSSVPNAAYSSFSGHSAHVTNVRFTFDDELVISTGGLEKSIIQWKFKYDSTLQSEIDSASYAHLQEQKNERSGATDFFDEQEKDQGVRNTSASIKPYMGQIANCQPEKFRANPQRDNSLPSASLTLNHIFGYRTRYGPTQIFCQNTAKYLNGNRIAFCAASVGIVMQQKNKSQSFFLKHDADVIAIAVHPKGNLVATGQFTNQSNTPVDIFVWDSQDKNVRAHINDLHLNGITALEFSPDGTYLLSVGMDPDYSFAVHDWIANRVVATSQVDKRQINAVVWKNNNQFVTIGDGSVIFWTLQNQIPTQIVGSQTNTAQICGTFIVANNTPILVTGGANGSLFIWNQSGNTYANQEIPQAHAGRIGSILTYKSSIVITGGEDCQVYLWNYTSGNLSSKPEPLVDLNSKAVQFNGGVLSLALDQKSESLMIGTRGGQILETQMSSPGSLTSIMQSHYEGELWGCASKGDRVVTSGGDKFIRSWDISEKKVMLRASKMMPNQIRALDWRRQDDTIVAGDLKGMIYLIDANTLEIKQQRASKFNGMTVKNQGPIPFWWIMDIQFSPDGLKVAFGAIGNGAPSNMEIWEVTEEGKFNPNQKTGNHFSISLNGGITHLDWNVSNSADNSYIMVNSDAYEIQFVSEKSKAAVSNAATVQDHEWYTFTSNLSWATQGIFPVVDGEGVNAVARCEQQDQSDILATGADNGSVSLFRFPVVTKKQVKKEYFGHSSKVTRVKFTSQDRYLITLGGNDKSVMIWSVDKDQDAPFEIRESEQSKNALNYLDIDVVTEKVKLTGADKFGKGVKKDLKLQEDDDFFQTEEADKGDEFSAVKPWLGAIKEPTSYYKDPLNQSKAPPVQLILDFVHGYRSKDARNNLRYLQSGNIVYHAAALGIVMDISGTIMNQKFFNKHENDITALDIHPDGIRVATGQIGPKPTIYVWDTNTLMPVCTFQGNLTQGIASLAFSASGDKLVAVAIDPYHEVAVYDINAKSQLGGCFLFKERGGQSLIIDVKWKNDSEFTTVGVNHIKFWNYSNTGIKSKNGTFPQSSEKEELCTNLVTCTWVPDGDLVSGTLRGEVQFFKGNSCQRQLKCHESKPVQCIHYAHQCIFTGGSDGKICVIDAKSPNILFKINLEQNLKSILQIDVRSIHLNYEHKNLLIGLYSSEIWEISTKDAKFNNSTRFGNARCLLKGHYAPSKKTTNEVWGLAFFPNDSDMFATCSDDCTLRTWSIKRRQQIKMVKTMNDANLQPIQNDHRTNEPQDSCKGRCIAISSDGEHIVVGFQDGTIRVFDKDLNQQQFVQNAQECISDLQISLDGSTLAVGSHDNAIYLYTFPSIQLKTKPLRQHSSYITHLDFSQDGNYIHSNCGAYELLFWEVNQGKQQIDGSSRLRDEKWLTWTATLGWPVQGIWPEQADGTDINSVDRSKSSYSGSEKPPDNYSLLATGDDYGQVKIFRYPCIKKNGGNVLGIGHSSHVTCVRWSNDDEFLVSTGGDDNCTFLWKVNKLK